MSSINLIEKMGLKPHPEGGYFKETYRSEINLEFEGFSSQRSLSTCIYFLLEKGDVSKLHTIKSDEAWYHHEGAPIEIIDIDELGKTSVHICGRASEGFDPQIIIKAGHLFGARLLESHEDGYSLVSCSVAPGFDFADFHMPSYNEIKEKYSNFDQRWQNFIKGQES